MTKRASGIAPLFECGLELLLTAINVRRAKPASCVRALGRPQAVVLVTVLAIGCAGSHVPKPDLGRIVVREFEVSPTVTTVLAYDYPTDELGSEVSNRIVKVLQTRGRDAVAAPRGAEIAGDVEVTGRIGRIDGGSRGTRVLVSQTIGFGWTSYGIGGATCAIDGRVTRISDGAVIGTFGQQVTKSGVGWFWIRYGESSERQVRAILLKIASNVGNMVDTGRYTGLGNAPEPAIQPASVQAQPITQSVAERLRELDRLRQEGLINQREYEQRRAAILDAL